jgi:hypothetical protein
MILAKKQNNEIHVNWIKSELPWVKAIKKIKKSKSKRKIS